MDDESTAAFPFETLNDYDFEAVPTTPGRGAFLDANRSADRQESTSFQSSSFLLDGKKRTVSK